MGIGGVGRRRCGQRCRGQRGGGGLLRLLLHRRDAGLLVPDEDVEVDEHERREDEDHQRVALFRRSRPQSGVGGPFLARRRSSADHGPREVEQYHASRCRTNNPYSEPPKVMATPPDDLPPRQQLDLFGIPGQGAAQSEQDMAKKSEKKSASKAEKKAEKKSKKASGGGGGGGGIGGGGGGGMGAPGMQDASLEAEARRRYLNYALSVITSRALPDVRDGLKPVQRRILYAMLHDEHLRPEAKYRKSATVVGTVLGRYHPHGDTSVYDAMVRMAQDFSLRLPLVDGSGNFGSLDGDMPAAYRYTECRLAPPAMELLRELDSETVEFRANYDGTTDEPTVLPARFPNL